MDFELDGRWFNWLGGKAALSQREHRVQFQEAREAMSCVDVVTGSDDRWFEDE